MLNLLRLVHVFFGLNALAAGLAVCTRMITGRSFGRWVRSFLRFSLASSSVGLILSIHHASVTQLLTMLTVYLSGFAVFSWRKYSTSDGWGPAVVLSTLSVFSLQTVIIMAHICRAMAECNLISSAQSQVQMGVLITTAVMLFAILSTMSLKRIHQHAINSVMRKVADEVVSPTPRQSHHRWPKTGEITVRRAL